MNENVDILVVDDDPDVLNVTARMVASLGYHVEKASSGDQCRAMIDKKRPDMIVLDVMLPDIMGTELCKEIKSNPDQSGAFIVLTSGMKISSDDQTDGLEFGADSYIARPISNREFKARIKAMVRILLAERERDQLIVELKQALSKVKQLNGLLPFCSYCKKIRDDKGYWNQIEEYIQTYSEAQLGDSICPSCARTYYPGINIYQD